MKSAFLFLSATLLSVSATAYAPLSIESRVLDIVLKEAIVIPNVPQQPRLVTPNEIGLIMVCVPGHNGPFSYIRLTHRHFELYGSQIALFCHNGQLTRDAE